MEFADYKRVVTHYLIIKEIRLPIPMWMIHLITRTGILVSFNMLNVYDVRGFN